MFQLTARQVRAYKGAAISILMLLMVERRPMNQGEMRRGTAYHDEAINDAVWMLREDGLIVETGRYTWALLDGMRQLPIGATLPEGEETSPQPSPEGEGEELEELGPDDPELATGFEETIEEPVDNSVDNFVDNFEIKKLGPDDPELGDHACMQDSNSLNINNENPTYMHPSGPDNPELDQALEDAGFRDPALTRLRQRRGLTARVVRYHVSTAPSLGAAITRIEQNWHVPEEWERTGKSYTGGLYAEFIQH